MKTSITFSKLLLFICAFISSNIILSQKPQSSDKGYKVVINHEEQYSIWPIGEKFPIGWKETRIKGDLGKCQKYIEEIWTDMRPLSIRKMKLPDDTPYMVVVNHEEQYSIWPVDKAFPKGWKPEGFKGTLYPCVKYIEEVWTDMRPLSIRKRLK